MESLKKNVNTQITGELIFFSERSYYISYKIGSELSNKTKHNSHPPSPLSRPSVKYQICLTSWADGYLGMIAKLFKMHNISFLVLFHVAINLFSIINSYGLGFPPPFCLCF